MAWDGKTGIDDDECVVNTVNGQAVVFASVTRNPEGCDYVRFIRLSDQRELLYYNRDEWREDPEEVMGCIMAAIQNGATPFGHQKRQEGAKDESTEEG